ncbi:hypothetical protein WKK05_07555 [Nostoc sp. UHCC 0302]|uniref:hypothetical protein n=1 Tax=Nostoc sp. UHCC 0302 TaxID=3134896 RepID=UPI00311CB37D
MIGNLRYRTAQSPLGGECSHTCGSAAEWTAEPEGLCQLKGTLQERPFPKGMKS